MMCSASAKAGACSGTRLSGKSDYTLSGQPDRVPAQRYIGTVCARWYGMSTDSEAIDQASVMLLAWSLADSHEWLTALALSLAILEIA